MDSPVREKTTYWASVHTLFRREKWIPERRCWMPKRNISEAATENKRGSKKGKVMNLTGKNILQVREDSGNVVSVEGPVATNSCPAWTSTAFWPAPRASRDISAKKWSPSDHGTVAEQGSAVNKQDRNTNLDGSPINLSTKLHSGLLLTLSHSDSQARRFKLGTKRD